jgi:hypothetical protein
VDDVFSGMEILRISYLYFWRSASAIENSPWGRQIPLSQARPQWLKRSLQKASTSISPEVRHLCMTYNAYLFTKHLILCSALLCYAKMNEEISAGD